MFWMQALRLAEVHHISIRGLVDVIKSFNSKTQTLRRRNRDRCKTILLALFSKRGSMRDFCEHMSVVAKTGNMDKLLDVIRKRLSIPGMRFNIVPCSRSVRRTTATLVRNFVALCNPERTFSGFRLDLVACVRLAAHCRKLPIHNLGVDIWGDGVEIGGVEVTRMAFRLLRDDISAQSANAVFCFAGKINLIVFFNAFGNSR